MRKLFLLLGLVCLWGCDGVHNDKDFVDVDPRNNTVVGVSSNAVPITLTAAPGTVDLHGIVGVSSNAIPITLTTAPGTFDFHGIVGVSSNAIPITVALNKDAFHGEIKEGAFVLNVNSGALVLNMNASVFSDKEAEAMRAKIDAGAAGIENALKYAIFAVLAAVVLICVFVHWKVGKVVKQEGGSHGHLDSSE